MTFFLLKSRPNAKPKHVLNLIFRAQYLHSKNTGCFGAQHVSEFCFGKNSPFFTMEISFLFSSVIFLDSAYHFGETLRAFWEVFSCPSCGEYWRWAYDPTQSSVSNKIGTALLLRCWIFLLLWSALSLFSPNRLLMWSSITPPTAGSSGSVVLFSLSLLQQQLRWLVPLAGLPRVGMETPCSGWVWWAYWCVSNCSLKTETEDT